MYKYITPSLGSPTLPLFNTGGNYDPVSTIFLEIKLLGLGGE